jgi:uncharacterized repeat protein (TIGR01451 family)
MKTMRLLCAMLMLSATTSVALADGEIALRNQVQKVEYFTNEDGVTESRLIEPASVVPGDELRYTIFFENQSEDVVVDEGSVVITNPIPTQVVYLEDSANGSGTTITYSADGGETFGEPDDLVVETADGERLAEPEEYTHIRWVFEPALEPGAQGSVFFRARLR